VRKRKRQFGAGLRSDQTPCRPKDSSIHQDELGRVSAARNDVWKHKLGVCGNGIVRECRRRRNQEVAALIVAAAHADCGNGPYCLKRAAHHGTGPAHSETRNLVEEKGKVPVRPDRR